MTPGRGDIAIIGLECAFPGSPGAQCYWDNLLHKMVPASGFEPGDLETLSARALADAGYGDPVKLNVLRQGTEVIVGDSAVPGHLSGSIASRLQLMGVNCTVDASAASSLTALNMAVHALHTGRCDMVLAGGVHVPTPSTMSIAVESKAFPYEMGVLVLRRLDDAERAGDRVYAVIKDSKESATARDGYGLETQGTAGIIQAVLALHHKVLLQPKAADGECNYYNNFEIRPWIHGTGETPRRARVSATGSNGARTSVVLEEYTGPHTARWLQHAWDSEMFVISGATRQEMLREAERLLANIRLSSGEFSLKNLAWTLNCRDVQSSRLAIVATSREDLMQKLERAIDRLQDEHTTRIRAIEGIYYFSQPLAGKLAFVFPGEGAQYTSMLADLCMHFPEVREFFDLMDSAFAGHPRGYLPGDMVFPPLHAKVAAAGEDRLYSMEGGAEAVFAANQALHALVEKLGIRPDAMVGHSIGEHSALLAAGVILPGDRRELIRHIRSINGVFEEMKHAVGIPRGTLVTVAGADHALLEKLVAESDGELHMALDNCPHQVVICGPEPAVDELIQALAGKVAICQKLPFARAYHTPWFEVFNQPLRRYFETVPMRKSSVAVYSSITAARYPLDDLGQVRDIIATGWASTVRFREAIRSMYRDGVRIFVEVGPRGNLTGFIDDILRGKPYIAIPANVPQRGGILQLHHMLAQLVAHGVPVRLAHLYERRDPTLVPNHSVTGRPLGPVHVPSPDPAAKVPAATPTPWPAQRAPGDGAVLEQHLQTMARFLEVQNQVMTAYLSRNAMPAAARPAKAAKPATGAPGPFITEILEITPGVRARARHRFSLDRERFFADHTLGRNVSQEDHELTGLPVVPLSIFIEILAEAGALLRPGQVLVGVRDLRVYRWLTLEQPGVTIELTAEQREGPQGPGVYVSMRKERVSSGRKDLGPVFAEGLMLFAPQYPPAAPAEVLTLENERRSRWTPDRLYVDGMFHGPAFQAVRTVDRTGENGASSTLEALPRHGMITGVPQPAYLIDPVLLDAAGQVWAFWSQEQLDPTGDIFPYRLAALDCYGPPPDAGTSMESHVMVTYVSDREIHSDLEIVDKRGRPLYRIRQCEARRFSQTPEFWQLRSSPRDSSLSDLWNEPIAAFRQQGPLVCCRVDSFSREFFESAQGIWRSVLAYMVLSRREREHWNSMRAVDKRRQEWLLGRCAAKDAVRLLIERHLGVQLAPADVEVLPDAYGRPRVEGNWTKRLRIQPGISISHSHGMAVALAALDPQQLVGIDLESLDQKREGFEAIAFGPDERKLLANVRQDLRQEWALRMWCAKEAVGKALGRGLTAGLQAFHITDAEIATGVVQLELRDRALDQFPQLRGKPMIAYTAREMDFVFSTIIYQQGAVQ